MRIIKKTGDVYVFLNEVKQDLTFSFTNSKTLPMQTIEIQYCADNPTPWAIQQGNKLTPIHNIQKWIWEHQKDINNKIREMSKGS
jgi:hypothetical protein